MDEYDNIFIGIFQYCFDSKFDGVLDQLLQIKPDPSSLQIYSLREGDCSKVCLHFLIKKVFISSIIEMIKTLIKFNIETLSASEAYDLTHKVLIIDNNNRHKQQFIIETVTNLISKLQFKFNILYLQQKAIEEKEKNKQNKQNKKSKNKSVATALSYFKLLLDCISKSENTFIEVFCVSIIIQEYSQNFVFIELKELVYDKSLKIDYLLFDSISHRDLLLYSDKFITKLNKNNKYQSDCLIKSAEEFFKDLFNYSFENMIVIIFTDDLIVKNSFNEEKEFRINLPFEVNQYEILDLLITDVFCIEPLLISNKSLISDDGILEEKFRIFSECHDKERDDGEIKEKEKDKNLVIERFHLNKYLLKPIKSTVFTTTVIELN